MKFKLQVPKGENINDLIEKVKEMLPDDCKIHVVGVGVEYDKPVEEGGQIVGYNMEIDLTIDNSWRLNNIFADIKGTFKV